MQLATLATAVHPPIPADARDRQGAHADPQASVRVAQRTRRILRQDSIDLDGCTNSGHAYSTVERAGARLWENTSGPLALAAACTCNASARASDWFTAAAQQRRSMERAQLILRMPAAAWNLPTAQEEASVLPSRSVITSGKVSQPLISPITHAR